MNWAAIRSLLASRKNGNLNLNHSRTPLVILNLEDHLYPMMTYNVSEGPNPISYLSTDNRQTKLDWN